MLAVIFVGARFTDAWINTEWLYYRARYDELEPHDLQALADPAALICIGTVGAFAFLSLVPPRRTWYTQLGGATLVVYLFHGFVVKSLLYAGVTFGGHHHGRSAGAHAVRGAALDVLPGPRWPACSQGGRPDRCGHALRRRRGLPPPGDVPPHEAGAPTKESAP